MAARAVPDAESSRCKRKISESDSLKNTELSRVRAFLQNYAESYPGIKFSKSDSELAIDKK